MSKADSSREIREVIDGLKDLIIDRKSFVQEKGDIFSRDIQILERAIALIQNYGTKKPTVGFSQIVKTGWISVKDALPELSASCCTAVIACDGECVNVLLYERANVRGKTVTRWKYMWNRIYVGKPITHWMPLPEPPVDDGKMKCRDSDPSENGGMGNK